MPAAHGRPGAVQTQRALVRDRRRTRLRSGYALTGDTQARIVPITALVNRCRPDQRRDDSRCRWNRRIAGVMAHHMPHQPSFAGRSVRPILPSSIRPGPRTVLSFFLHLVNRLRQQPSVSDQSGIPYARKGLRLQIKVGPLVGKNFGRIVEPLRTRRTQRGEEGHYQPQSHEGLEG